ncbi:hypothetical protein KSZ_17430 [Dictyobacter formicarum]|uniref:Uncharacterized protein n=1 Tax=Dictyobacter formicarum TaxID=2778368 RepID=A0ABQ3VCU8_9CHLR|nr:hypothetical protein KSZ_17430 [Dictyobacter formicarum]
MAPGLEHPFCEGTGSLVKDTNRAQGPNRWEGYRPLRGKSEASSEPMGIMFVEGFIAWAIETNK